MLLALPPLAVFPTLLAVLEEIALLALPPLEVLPVALEKLLAGELLPAGPPPAVAPPVLMYIPLSASGLWLYFGSTSMTTKY
jgi:hypothetical protein